MLQIAGFQGTSLIDFPGKISSIVFLGGCNLRCPYCHNGALFDCSGTEMMPLSELYATLEKRRKFIDGVVFTGGEPSLHKDLPSFVRDLKEKYGFEIKMDSNGLEPDFVGELVNIVDYFCIDIKTTPARYKDLGAEIPASEIERRLLATKSILESSKKKVEYRTTMYPPVVESYEVLYKMLDFVPRNADYYLQRFIPLNAWSEIGKNTETFTPDALERMALELRRDMRRERIFLRTYA